MGSQKLRWLTISLSFLCGIAIGVAIGIVTPMYLGVVSLNPVDAEPEHTAQKPLIYPAVRNDERLSLEQVVVGTWAQVPGENLLVLDQHGYFTELSSGSAASGTYEFVSENTIKFEYSSPISAQGLIVVQEVVVSGDNMTTTSAAIGSTEFVRSESLQ